MRRVGLLAVATVACLLATTLMWISPASAAGTISVTPTSGLTLHQLVRVNAAGYPAGVSVGICQGVMNGVTASRDCSTTGTIIKGTSPTGTFSFLLEVRRYISVPSLGRTVDCAVEACAVAAALYEDIANTVEYVPLTFDPGLADGRIKRRSDGVIFGDDVFYTATGFELGSISPQNRWHTIEPGGYWTFALQVQNDGLTTANLTVRASSSAFGGLPAEVRFFYAYSDITASVRSSSGYTFAGMAPGEVRTFALQFHVPADSAPGFQVNATIDFASGDGRYTDRLGEFVVVPTPN
jgi:hypothetical protein